MKKIDSKIIEKYTDNTLLIDMCVDDIEYLEYKIDDRCLYYIILNPKQSDDIRFDLMDLNEDFPIPKDINIGIRYVIKLFSYLKSNSYSYIYIASIVNNITYDWNYISSEFYDINNTVEDDMENDETAKINILCLNAPLDILRLLIFMGKTHEAYISMNKNITEKFVKEYQQPVFNYFILQLNESISLDFIDKHINPQCGYSYEYIQFRTDIDIEFIYTHNLMKYEVWSQICRNPAISFNVIMQHKDLPWNMAIFNNPTLTYSHICSDEFKDLYKKINKHMSHINLLTNEFEFDKKVSQISEKYKNNRVAISPIVNSIIRIPEITNIIIDYMIYW
jgi:hypothetical protein